MPRVGWYLDVKTITILYVFFFFFFFFFFFPVGDLDERDTVKPDGKVCVAAGMQTAVEYGCKY